MRAGSPRRRTAALTRLRSCAAALAVMAVLCAGVTACGSSGGSAGSGGGSGPSLALNEGQDAISSCLADSPSSGLPTWDTPVGYAEDMYWNKSSVPLTIESVALLDPHDLVLHGSVLYKMVHAEHALPLAWPWIREGQKVPPAEWRARQRIPGPVMPPAGGPVDVNGNLSHKIDLYEIVVRISATTPAGGWALGEIVRYKTADHIYTFKARTGLGIGSAQGPVTHSCDAKMKAIAAAFATKK
jgi:hypothetical protein